MFGQLCWALKNICNLSFALEPTFTSVADAEANSAEKL